LTIVRGNSIFSATKKISLIMLIFSLPVLAQRWDYVATFPITTSTFTNMSGLTTGPDGAMWYSDSYRNVVGRMTTTGAVTEYTACCTPAGIVTGPDGALWFGMNNGIGRITTTGAFTFNPLSSCCTSIQGITVGPDGALWFTEGGCCSSSGGIGRITTAGIITEFAQIANSNPLGIAAGKDGNLWFTEQTGNRIGRITTAGVIVEFPVPSCCGLGYITAGPDGALWFTEPTQNKIGRISLHGVITEYAVPTSGSSPFGITTGPDKAIWFTEQNAARFGRITAPQSASGGSMFVEYSLPAGYFQLGVIAAGPDGNLWFSAPNGTYPSEVENLARAAACAPDLSLTYANSQLNMGFTLGTSEMFNFGVYLFDGAGMKTLGNVSKPAYAPPRSFTETIKNFTGLGSVGVLSTVGSSTSGLLCYDLEVVSASGAAATTNAVQEVRRAIVDSGIVDNLPQP
jgi:virginiamycin B lyase